MGHLTLMNSRRGEPCALFITFHLVNRKRAVDPEHLLSKGVHFGVSCKQGSFVYMLGYIYNPVTLF